jgi:hypothetical protein
VVGYTVGGGTDAGTAPSSRAAGSIRPTRGFDIPKASAESVARAIFDGVDNGEKDIFPDPMSAAMAEGWRSGAAKALERQNAALAEAAGVKS